MMSGCNSKSNSPREWEELNDVVALQQRAVELLALCDPKPVIALDLDYTVSSPIPSCRATLYLAFSSHFL